MGTSALLYNTPHALINKALPAKLFHATDAACIRLTGYFLPRQGIYTGLHKQAISPENQ